MTFVLCLEMSLVHVFTVFSFSNSFSFSHLSAKTSEIYLFDLGIEVENPTNFSPQLVNQLSQ